MSFLFQMGPVEGMNGGGGTGEEHQNPAVRVCDVTKPLEGSCGFHLTRTKWDPYPWVCGVDPDSAASQAGLQVRDYVLLLFKLQCCLYMIIEGFKRPRDPTRFYETLLVCFITNKITRVRTLKSFIKKPVQTTTIKHVQTTLYR